MKIVKCPECGKENILTRGQNFQQCEYCGAKAPKKSNKKKIIAISVSVSLTVAAVICAVLVYVFTVANVTVDGVKYKLFGGEYRVVSYDPELKSEIEIKSSIKGKKVVAIEEEAFSGSSIKGVSVPASVKTIKEEAFANCDKLEYVKLVPGLTKIKGYAFYHCDKLSQITYGGNKQEWEYLCHGRVLSVKRSDGTVVTPTVTCLGLKNEI